jgi:hypothetical protein
MTVTVTLAITLTEEMAVTATIFQISEAESFIIGELGSPYHASGVL